MNSWQKGKVPASSLRKLWDPNFSEKVQEKIINILEKFEIIFCSYKTVDEEGIEKKKSLETLDHLLIPSLLPAKPPKEEYEKGILVLEESKKNLVVHKRDVLFQFIALGFFSRLIVRFLNSGNFTVNECWLNGLLISDDIGDSALVVCVVDHERSQYVLKVISHYSQEKKKIKK